MHLKLKLSTASAWFVGCLKIMKTFFFLNNDYLETIAWQTQKLH